MKGHPLNGVILHGLGRAMLWNCLRVESRVHVDAVCWRLQCIIECLERPNGSGTATEGNGNQASEISEQSFIPLDDRTCMSAFTFVPRRNVL